MKGRTGLIVKVLALGALRHLRATEEDVRPQKQLVISTNIDYHQNGLMQTQLIPLCQLSSKSHNRGTILAKKTWKNKQKCCAVNQHRLDLKH